MNRYQKAYALMRAQYEAIIQEHDKKEECFCKAREYKTETGKPASRIWMIDDEQIFNKVNAEYCTLYSYHDDERNQAADALREAEDNLIEWGLSIIPKNMVSYAETLRLGAKTQLKIRKKLIDLAFRADVEVIQDA